MDSKRFIIADTHFAHGNIIKYENRPFTTADEMDKAMIRNWNAAVSPADTIFHLGDFGFGSDGYLKGVLARLNGRKVLIMGNHDRFHRQTPLHFRNLGFDEVSAYPIILDEFWMLSHEPLYVTPNAPYANIHGHVHSSPTYVDVSPRSFCACVERIGYAPVDFEDIKARVMAVGG